MTDESYDSFMIGQLIDQRDEAENALGTAYEIVTGKECEWSNNFGYAEALAEIQEASAPRNTEENRKAANEIRELYSAINVAIACLIIDDDGGALDALHGAENDARNKLEN